MKTLMLLLLLCPVIAYADRPGQNAPNESRTWDGESPLDSIKQYEKQKGRIDSKNNIEKMEKSKTPKETRLDSKTKTQSKNKGISKKQNNEYINLLHSKSGNESYYDSRDAVDYALKSLK